MISQDDNGHVVIGTDFTPEDMTYISQGLIHTTEAALQCNELSPQGRNGIMSTLRLLIHLLPNEDQSIALLSQRTKGMR